MCAMRLRRAVRPTLALSHPRKHDDEWETTNVCLHNSSSSVSYNIQFVGKTPNCPLERQALAGWALDVGAFVARQRPRTMVSLAAVGRRGGEGAGKLRGNAATIRCCKG